MYRITFYVPISEAQQVKQALFDIGAGKIGQYDHCCWQTQGTGQFRALPGSHPKLGIQNKIHTEAELKIEICCEDHLIKLALKTLIQNHPYEVPAYEAYRITTLEDLINKT